MVVEFQKWYREQAEAYFKIIRISQRWKSQISWRVTSHEDLQKFVQPGLNPPEVADAAPMDGIRFVTERVAGKLLQTFQFGVDGGDTCGVGVEGNLLGVHRGFRDVIDTPPFTRCSIRKPSYIK